MEQTFRQGADSPGNWDLVRDYLDWCADVRHRSLTTVKTYADCLGAWLKHIGTSDIRTISRSEMESFVTRVRVRRGHGLIGKPATQRKDVAALRAFYKWLEEEAEVHVSPARALHGPVVHNVNPKPIPDNDWAELWDSEMSPQLRSALGLGFFCGLRRQEIFSLTSAQITVSKVSDMTRKGGGKHTLPWREMYEILVEWNPALDHQGRFPEALRVASRASQGLLLAPWPTDPQTLNKRMLKLCQSINSKSYTPHQLRHSAATNLLRAGVPLHMVSALLNHSSPTITMRYVKATGDELAEWRRQRGL